MQSNNTIIRQLKLYGHYTKLKYRGFKKQYFAANAYFKAAQAISEINEPLSDIRSIRGIGQKLESQIREIIETGSFRDLNRVIEKYGDLSDLISIRGIGIIKAFNLYTKYNVKTKHDLKKRIDNGSIKDKIINRVLSVETDRISLQNAKFIAKNIIKILKEDTPKANIICVGSIRRKEKTIGDIDILSDSPKTQELFVKLGSKLECGKRKSSIVKDGRYIELNIIPRKSWGTALLHSTGNSYFNKQMRIIAKDRGLRLNEYNVNGNGVEQYFSSEIELFNFLDIAYVPPENRCHNIIELSSLHHITECAI